MKKSILILALALVVLLGVLPVHASAAGLQSADIRFFYDADEAFLEVKGITPAEYGQHLNVVVYDPSTDGAFSLDDVKDSETGEISVDPAALCPLMDLTKILRIKEATAESDGSFSTRIPIGESLSDGQYIIVQISGGGKNHVSSSYIRMFKTAQAIEDEILGEFQDASTSEMGALLKEYELLLGVNLDEEYKSNKTMIHNLFVSVRDKDILQFESLNDILKAWDYAQSLLKLSKNPTTQDVEEFIENYEELIDYDFSEENEDYTQMAEEVHSLTAGIFAESAPDSMNKVKETLEQSVALSMVNSKNGTTVSPVIQKYAGILGISYDDYENYCEKYGEYEVNKAFVGQDFKNTIEVTTAFENRIDTLKNGETNNGGGGAPSSSHDSNWITKDDNSGSVAPKPTFTVKYSDLQTTHWAYYAVAALSEKGVINGFSDGSFKPDETVTREQFVKMIVNAFGINGEGEFSFEDIENERWSAPFIRKAIACGITKGVSESLFAPEADVTRQDAAVMLHRICKVNNIALSGEATLIDAEIVSNYAKESVNALAGAGVINGFDDGNFKPFEALTRGQAAKLIYALVNR